MYARHVFLKKEVEVFTLVYALFAILWKVQKKSSLKPCPECPPVLFMALILKNKC
jgi:hypothetical protein